MPTSARPEGNGMQHEDRPTAEQPATPTEQPATPTEQPATSTEQPAAPTEQPAYDQVTRDLEDRLLRTLADAENLRKRHARELRQQSATERDRIAAAWLPVLDNLDRALANAGTGTDALVMGVLAVRDEAVDVMARLGYPRHDEVGVPFDPKRHEVVSVVDDPEFPPGTVVRVLRPGYGDPDHLLRPAAVAVNQRQE
jgi:molecular chaperone GrpE